MKIIKGIISLIIGGLLGFTINYYVFSDIVAIYYPENSMVFYTVLIATVCCCILMIGFILFQQIDARILLFMKIAYFCALLVILFGRESMTQEVVLNPFESIKDLKDPEMIMQSALNLIVFIPMGFIFRNQNFQAMLIKSIIISCGVEMSQWVLSRGFFDTFDIVLYITGIAIGYFIFKHMKIEIIGNDVSVILKAKNLFKEIVNDKAE